MKTLKLWLAAAIVVAAGAATPATAGTVPINAVFDPDPDVLFGAASNAVCLGDTTTGAVSGAVSGECYSLEFTFDIAPLGYDNPPDTLTSAALSLFFYDLPSDNGLGNPESVQILLNLDDQGQFVITNNSTSGTTQEIPFVDVTSFLADGQLTVKLIRGTLQGEGQVDFYFDKATLDGAFDEPDIQLIPEPASLMLFGAGLTAAVARMRKRGRPVA